MGIGYQRTDRACFDYRLWYLPDVRVPIRGPRISLESRAPYISFLGAAQTFGRFCHHPFPQRVGQFLEIASLNLGISGAGPRRYSTSASLMSHINRSLFAVVQVMSARSADTDLLKTQQNQGVVTFQSGPLAGKSMLAAQAYRQLRDRYGRKAFDRQVRAAQESWLRAYRELLAAIDVPILLLWTSTGPPPVTVACGGSMILGVFPHLVTKTMLCSLESSVHAIIDAGFERERPQLLTNAQTRQAEEIFDSVSFPHRPEWSRCFNTYYPTPEAHDHAARRLITYILGDRELGRLLEERS